MASGMGSEGPPGWATPGLCEKESRWMSACLEARLLISLRPTRSPLLKFPFPCLNSQSVESGEPVWKTSLTKNPSHQLGNPSRIPRAACSFLSHTFVEPIHVQLPYK